MDKMLVYRSSSNKHGASNKDLLLTMAAPLTLRSEQAPLSNEHLPLISAALQNAVHINDLAII